MAQFTHFIGIDVSKLKLNFALCIKGEIIFEAECANKPAAIKKLLKEIESLVPLTSLYCIEHTGMYCHPFLKVAEEKALSVWLENPGTISRATMMARAKTDPADARKIARYAMRYQDRCRLWQADPKPLRKLRELLRHREHLVKQLTALKNPINEAKSVGDELVHQLRKKSSTPIIKALEKAIKQLKEQIDALSRVDDQVAKKSKLLQSIPGIGQFTALYLLVFTRNFELFDSPKQLACYCGVAPFMRSSGTSIRGKARVSKLANRTLKRMLHMAAMAAIRSNSELKTYYKRKVAEGKNKMAVINAVRNKLLHRAFAVINRGTEYVRREFSPSEENLVTRLDF